MPPFVSPPASILPRSRRAPGFAALLTGIAALLPADSFAQTPTAAPGASGYHLAATWKPGGDGGWDYLAFDPEAHRRYVTRTDRVQVIDGVTAARRPGFYSVATKRKAFSRVPLGPRAATG